MEWGRGKWMLLCPAHSLRWIRLAAVSAAKIPFVPLINCDETEDASGSRIKSAEASSRKVREVLKTMRSLRSLRLKKSAAETAAIQQVEGAFHAQKIFGSFRVSLTAQPSSCSPGTGYIQGALSFYSLFSSTLLFFLKTEYTNYWIFHSMIFPSAFALKLQKWAEN